MGVFDISWDLSDRYPKITYIHQLINIDSFQITDIIIDIIEAVNDTKSIASITEIL